MAGGIVVGMAGVLTLAGASTGVGDSPRGWSVKTVSADIGAALEYQSGRESLVVTLHPHTGVRIEPPVLLVDAPARMRSRIAVRFPTTVRTEGKGKGVGVRAALPLEGSGRLAFAKDGPSDGALSIEYRYCRNESSPCAVERVDIALRTID